MNTQIFVYGGRSSIFSKMARTLVVLGFTVTSVFAHEPGEGQRFTAGANAKSKLPALPNAASPVTDGQWVTLPYLMPINPIHCALLHNGKVLVVAGSENTLSQHQAGQFYAARRRGLLPCKTCFGMSFAMAWPVYLTVDFWWSEGAVNLRPLTVMRGRRCSIPQPKNSRRSRAWPMAAGMRACWN